MGFWGEDSDAKTASIIGGCIIVGISVIAYGAIVVTEICASVGGRC